MHKPGNILDVGLPLAEDVIKGRHGEKSAIYGKKGKKRFSFKSSG